MRVDRKELFGLVQDWAMAAALTGALIAVWSGLSTQELAHGAAPTLTLRGTDGGSFSLAEADAPAYVVNFWATWCAPCRAEIPEISEFAAAHPDVAVIGVSVDAGMAPERLAAESRRLGIAYDVLHDPSGSAARAWGVDTYPTTFVLDRERRIVATRIGVVDRHRLEDMLPSLH